MPKSKVQQALYTATLGSVSSLSGHLFFSNSAVNIIAGGVFGYGLSKLSRNTLTPEQERLLTPQQYIWTSSTPPEHQLKDIETILAAVLGAMSRALVEIGLKNIAGSSNLTAMLFSFIFVAATLRFISVSLTEAYPEQAGRQNAGLRAR